MTRAEQYSAGLVSFSLLELEVLIQTTRETLRISDGVGIFTYSIESRKEALAAASMALHSTKISFPKEVHAETAK